MTKKIHVLSSDSDLSAKRFLQDSEHKFRFKQFFAGLIFAIISFMAAHKINTQSSIIKSIEVATMILLFISGCLLLFQLAGYKGKEKIYWVCFCLGMLLLIFNRSMLLFGFKWVVR